MICKYKSTKFQVLLYIANNSIKHQLFVYAQLDDQTALFQTIQFSMPFVWTQFKSQFYLSHECPFSSSSTPSQSGPGSDGNEEVLRIPQSSSITGASSSDCLHIEKMLSVYSIVPADWAIGHTFWSYLSSEMWSVYFIVPVDWTTGHSLDGGRVGFFLPLQRSSWFIPSRLGLFILSFLPLYSVLRYYEYINANIVP